MSDSIYLSGGGSSQETFELDELFLNSTGNRILYLPVGLKRTFSGYDGCVQWFNDMLLSHNKKKKVTVFIDLKDKAEFIDVDKFDAIYIGGASDTFRLHNLLKKYGIYKKLSLFVSSGGVIYGGSGGATILGRTINYDQKDKQLLYLDESSADLCLGYSIFAHLNDNNLDLIRSKDFGHVIGIPEGGGCIIDPEKREVKYIGERSGIIVMSNSEKNIHDQDTVKI